MTTSGSMKHLNLVSIKPAAAQYDSYAYDTGGCSLVRQRVMTPYGWRLRRVQMCN